MKCASPPHPTTPHLTSPCCSHPSRRFSSCVLAVFTRHAMPVPLPIGLTGRTPPRSFKHFCISLPVVTVLLVALWLDQLTSATAGTGRVGRVEHAAPALDAGGAARQAARRHRLGVGRVE